MKEMIIEAPGKIVYREVPIPKRKNGEALLKLLYGGICGSDLGSYRGTFAYFSYPRIPGHEFSAEVLDVDEPNQFGIKKGMEVTCNPYYNCGDCYSCKRGFVNVCQNNQTLGCQRDGVFMSLIAMPLERIYDGKGLNPRVLAAVEPFCIGHHGVLHATIKKGENVLVVGAGTIGVFSSISALSQGANVFISDISEKKLDYAVKNFGLNGMILNRNREDFLTKVKEITNGNGFDVTIEAVGLPSTFQDCIDAVCFGGRVVLIGISKKNLDFDYTVIQRKELSIFGSRNALKKDFISVIDALAKKIVRIDKVITNIYSFEDGARAFEDFSKNQGSMLKVLLKF